MCRIAVLASTRGTDLQAIIDEMKAGKMPGIEIAVVISNNNESLALEKARNAGIKTVFVDPKGKKREQFDQELVDILNNEQVDLICLIGYMRILTPVFVREFRRRIINVHPALMPKFSGAGYYGANVHEAVLAAGETETGCTIHYVDEGVDTGPIIFQSKVPVLSGDTPETLQNRVQAAEKILYPEIIRRLASGKLS
jgi:phosphoribosylglycinamide formyltransferase-1